MQYNDENRGAIQLRDRARQIIDFRGLKYGSITPTDLDGLIEYKDKAFVLLEMKYGSAKMPYGQELALRRIVDGLQHSGKETLLLLCSHQIKNWEQDIIAACTPVASSYYHQNWRPGDGRTAKQYIDAFLHFVG